MQTCYYSLCFHSNANLLLFAVFSQQCKSVIIHNVFAAMQTSYYSQCFHTNANLLLFTLFSQQYKSVLFTVFSKQCKPVIIHRVLTAIQACFYSHYFHNYSVFSQQCLFKVFSFTSVQSDANLLLFTVCYYSQQCKPVIIHSVFTMQTCSVFKCKSVIIHNVFAAMQTCYYSQCYQSNANSPSFDSNTSLFLFTLFSQQCKPVIIQCFHSNANLLLFTVFSQQ